MWEGRGAAFASSHSLPMTWHGQSVSLYLWCAQPILQSVVAAIFWRRKLNKRFPVFFTFLLTQVVIFSVTFPLWFAGYPPKIYFIFFWLGDAINVFLGFKVIHEIFLDVFRPYHTLKDLGTLLFRWAGVVLLLVSIVVAFSNSLDQTPLIHAVTTLQRSVRIVQLGLILFLLLFSRYLGVSRKQISFGVSLGFGLFASVDLMMYALHSGGFVGQSQLNLINMATYIAAIFIWLSYSLARPDVRVEPNHLQTQRWEQGLADLQRPLPSDSLIPMFENMVERAFSRNSNLENAEDPLPPPTPPPNPPRANSAAAGSKNRP